MQCTWGTPSPHCITMTSWWPWWRLKSPASRLFPQTFIQTQIKENIKAPRHWALWGEFTGTGEFPAQRASYAENVSIWWRHHVITDTGNSPCQLITLSPICKQYDVDMNIPVTSFHFLVTSYGIHKNSKSVTDARIHFILAVRNAVFHMIYSLLIVWLISG